MWKEKPQFRSPVELQIHPGQLRYKVYLALAEGKNIEETYASLSAEGEFDHQIKSDAIRFIAYYLRIMTGAIL